MDSDSFPAEPFGSGEADAADETGAVSTGHHNDRTS